MTFLRQINPPITSNERTVAASDEAIPIETSARAVRSSMRTPDLRSST